MEKTTLESTNKLLKVIIALLLRRKDDQVLSLRQQIQILYNLGITPVEIADILGRSNTYISKELSLMRKSQKRGG